MPSRPLSADTSAVVKAYTRLHNEAIDVTKGRTDMPAAVARLVQLIPPARVDLVDEVLVRVGRRDLNLTLDWPPVHLIHQLAFRVKGAPWRDADAGSGRRGRRRDPLPRQECDRTGAATGSPGTGGLSASTRPRRSWPRWSTSLSWSRTTWIAGDRPLSKTTS
jgi:hypothetical protein